MALLVKVMADNDVAGQLAVIRRIIESEGWLQCVQLSDIVYVDFPELNLVPRASDRIVWKACQAAGVVLVTGNRTGGQESLDQAIQELTTSTSLPVITISDTRRLMHDRLYAEACAIQFLARLENIDSLRGSGRLYIP